MNRPTEFHSHLLARSRVVNARSVLPSARRIGLSPGVIRIALLGVIIVAAPSARAEQDAFETMRSYGDFDVFCDLIEKANLVDFFKVDGPITVFAPTDKAFQGMDANEIRALQDPGRIEDLRALIRYHVINQRLSRFDLKREKPYRTVEGKQVEFVDMGGDLLINDAYVDTADIRTSNGLVHAIDKVLIKTQ